MPLPPWLSDVRQTIIVNKVKADPRTSGDRLLGLPREQAREIIDRGQADFCEPKAGLSTDELALLYGWFNLLRHLEELVEAFQQIFHGSTITSEDPVVVDLGCGPSTACLALAAILGPGACYTYIGIDRAESMLRLGERLCAEAQAQGVMPDVTFRAAKELSAITWGARISWRPVIVIASYLLASPFLDVKALVRDLMAFVNGVSQGSVTLLYTNARGDWANRNLPEFRTALMRHGFEERAGGAGSVSAVRRGETRSHELEYALFYRPEGAMLERAEGEEP